jgi:hypothetical protein
MNTYTARFFASGIFWIALSIPSLAQEQPAGRVAQCRVETAGKIEMNGPCRFKSEAGGSFTLENIDPAKPLFGQTLTVSVSIVAPETADVRGLTAQGINSRWGAARHSTRDPACWENNDFMVCAR